MAHEHFAEADRDLTPDVPAVPKAHPHHLAALGIALQGLIADGNAVGLTAEGRRCVEAAEAARVVERIRVAEGTDIEAELELMQDHQQPEAA